MASINVKLLNKIVKFQLELRRLQAGERQKIIEVFKNIDQTVISKLSEGEVIEFGRAKIEKLLRELREPVSDAFKTIAADNLEINEEIVNIQLKSTEQALMATGSISTAVTIPSTSILDRILNDPLIRGGPMSAWWAKQERDTIFKLSSAVREGVLLGESNQAIIHRIVGTKTTPGLMNVVRSDAAALVQTATHTIANDAQQAVYAANADVIPSLVWFTALDSHVCPLCAARADKSWTNTPEHKPIGHSIPFQIPPIHFNDRCILLPEMEDLGLPIGERASSLGPIKGDTTFKQYLDMVPHEQLEKQLGKGRAALYKAGDISLTQLIDGTGRELTLKQLKNKYL